VFIWLAEPGSEYNIAAAVFLGVAGYALAIYVVSRLVEGPRPAMNRLVTTLVVLTFVIALLPLISLMFTVIVNGLPRFDLTFFTWSMRNVVGEGGGALHAIVGTLLMTGTAALISIPVGLLTSIYLVEYGRGPLARAVTFFVDVMTGIPSIVAGLFVLSFWNLGLGFGPSGFAGSMALAILMMPVVVRSTEEMLKLVPNELREASLALGVPKWRTILKVVLPTSVGGIATGVMLAVARITGETAPVMLLVFGNTLINPNPFSGAQESLPL